MGTVTSLAQVRSTRNGFPPMSAGRMATFFYRDKQNLTQIANGRVADINSTTVVIDDKTNDRIRRIVIPQLNITERLA